MPTLAQKLACFAVDEVKSRAREAVIPSYSFSEMSSSFSGQCWTLSLVVGQVKINALI
jgi:hypothetical protein